jgi:hypothetical protein
MAWLQKVQSDIDDILSGLTIDEVALKARPAFGTRAVNEALTQHKNRTARATVTSRLSLATAIIEKSNPTPRHWSI